MRRYDLIMKEPVEIDHDYVDMPVQTSLSEFQDAMIPYIAGYAAEMTANTCHCPTCHEALGSTHHISSSLFLNFRDQGGLFKPSESVVMICRLTELKIRQMMKTSGGKVPHGK